MATRSHGADPIVFSTLSSPEYFALSENHGYKTQLRDVNFDRGRRHTQPQLVRGQFPPVQLSDSDGNRCGTSDRKVRFPIPIGTVASKSFLPWGCRIAGRPAKQQSMDVRLPFARKSAAGSSPLPVRSTKPTVVASSIRRLGVSGRNINTTELTPEGVATIVEVLKISKS